VVRPAAPLHGRRLITTSRLLGGTPDGRPATRGGEPRGYLSPTNDQFDIKPGRARDILGSQCRIFANSLGCFGPRLEVEAPSARREYTYFGGDSTLGAS
jgi:hypothetical protein